MWFKLLPYVQKHAGMPFGAYQTAQQEVLLHTEGQKWPKQGKTTKFKALENQLFGNESQKY